MNFIDRQAELESILRAYDQTGSGLLVLYGRRRLGKTTLLRRFAEERPAIYHVADRMTERDAIRSLAQACALALNEPSLAQAEYPDWYALFAAFDRLRPRDRKTCLILDEYQYLCEIQPAFSSILQKQWDGHWQQQNFLLILCGSVLSMMYRETLARQSPLYGRRTGQYLLQPLSCRNTAAFFPQLTPWERLRRWAFCGGVPRYAELVAKYETFEAALRDCALRRDGALYAEVRFLLQEDVQSPSVYWSLLRTIAGGAQRLSEIAGRMGMAGTRLTPYLAALRELQLIERLVPITERQPAQTKRGIYCLTDNFLRLWFLAVAPYESLLAMGRVAQVEQRLADPLQNHFAWAWERVAQQHLLRYADALGLFHVGRFWDTHGEFDAVGVDERHTPVLVAECKWTPKALDLATAKSLADRVRRQWPAAADHIRYALFAPAGFAKDTRRWAAEHRALLVDAEAIFAETSTPENT